MPDDFPRGFSLDRGFDYDRIVGGLSKRVFGFDENHGIESEILGAIASNGPLAGNRIFRLVHEKNRGVTVNQVRYATSDKKNPRNLTQLTFLNNRQGKKSVKFDPDLHERRFSLTFKGFFASLSSTPFEKNYMVDKYRKFIRTQYSSIPYISDFCMQGIKYDVALFLFDQCNKGIVLRQSDNLIPLIGEFHESPKYSVEAPTYLEIREKDKKIYQWIVKRYYLITNLLVNLEDCMKRERNKPTALEPVISWQEYFENIQKYSKFDSNVFDYLGNYPSSSKVDAEWVFSKAREILKRYGINKHVTGTNFWM